MPPMDRLALSSANWTRDGSGSGFPCPAGRSLGHRSIPEPCFQRFRREYLTAHRSPPGRDSLDVRGRGLSRPAPAPGARAGTSFPGQRFIRIIVPLAVSIPAAQPCRAARVRGTAPFWASSLSGPSLPLPGVPRRGDTLCARTWRCTRRRASQFLFPSALRPALTRHFPHVLGAVWSPGQDLQEVPVQGCGPGQAP